MRTYRRPLIVTFSSLALATLFSYLAVALTDPPAKKPATPAAEESAAAIEAKQQAHRAELTAKAKAGDAKAMLDLGLACSVGFGGPIDRPGAVKWVRASADAGYQNAQYVYGKMLQRGEYLPKDLTEAVRWFRLSAEQGHPDGQLALAEAYARGEGIKADEAEQVRWLRLAAAQGHPLAQGYLGFVLYDQQKPDAWKEVADWLRKAAMQGDAEAMYTLGMLHLRGHGVTRDRLMALACFMIADFDASDETREQTRKFISTASASDRRLAGKLSKAIMDKMNISPLFVEGSRHFEAGKNFLAQLELAQQGKAEDQYELGRCYYEGLGTIPDHAEAVVWCRKAAEQGHVPAMRRLAMCLEDGDGVGQDLVEMAKWYRRAAEQNDSEAQFKMGACYFYGNGVEKDLRQAEAWTRKAAEQGHPSAQSNLGGQLISGEDKSRHAEAIAWLKKSAKQGHPFGMYKYGSLVMDGRGVAADRIEGAAWLIACLERASDDKLEVFIEKQLKTLTPEERTKAEAAAIEIKKTL